MKKKMLIMTVAAASMLFACQRQKDNEQQALADASKQELVQALNERDQLLSLVNEVTTGLEEIKQLENIMTVTARNPEKNASQRAQLQADMASVKERIVQRQAELKALEGKLAKANLGNTKLKETVKTLQAQIDTQLEEIETLKQQLAAAQEQIGTLTGEVGTLHSTVSTVTDERNAAKEASAQLEKALTPATTWWAQRPNSRRRKSLRRASCVKRNSCRAISTKAVSLSATSVCSARCPCKPTR